MRWLLLLVLGFGLLVGGLAVFEIGPFASDPRYSVLLISIDSLRQDRLGVYGHRPRFAPELSVSPVLDALAQEGVVFDEAWSTTSWTLPSHAALMTGWSDAAHGVVSDEYRIDPLMPMLAERFQAAGFATAGVFSGPYLDPRYGFGRGFDRYRNAMLPAEEYDEWLKQRNDDLERQGLPGLQPEQLQPLLNRQSHITITSPRVNQMGLEFLEQCGPNEDFFLFLHYFDAHYDYTPPPELARQFDPEYTGEIDGREWYFSPKIRDRKSGQRIISERDLQHVLALYDAEIHWVDQHIGRVFEWLKAHDRWETTIVAVVADHGDEFFDHGSIGHRSTLHTELTRIPMILRVPRELRTQERIRNTVRLYDIGPTLLDLAGLSPLESIDGRSLRPLLDGRSLRPLLEGRDDHEGALSLFAGFGPATRHISDAWRNERFTVIRLLKAADRVADDGRVPLEPSRHQDPRAPRFLVFDRSQDPQEKVPIPAQDSRYAMALQAFHKDLERHRDRWQTRPRSPDDLRYSEVLNESERATLVELGYTDDDRAGGSDQLPLIGLPPPLRRP